MKRISTTTAVLLALGLAACEPAEAPSDTPGAPVETPAPAVEVPAPPAGPGEQRAAAEATGAAVDVSQFQALPTLSAKVFSVSGGDPAANGLVTAFALFGGPAQGWRAYPLGDYAEWSVVEARAGRVVLAVREESAGPDGNIAAQARHVFIDFAWDGETPPDAVTVRTTP